MPHEHCSSAAFVSTIATLGREIDHENMLHRKKSLKLTAKIQDF
jgi:hypothetical protein